MIRLCAPTDEAGKDFDEAVFLMNKNGIHLAELRGIFGKSVLYISNDEANYCKQKLAENNIKVWSISSPIGKRDLFIPITEFEENIDRAIEKSKFFECENIRVFSFFDSLDKIDEVLKRLNLCVEKASKFNLNVCLENEKGSYADTAKRTLELLDKIPNLKLVYDSSNFIQVGEPSEMTLKEVFPRAYFVHFKDGIHVNDDADITPVGKGEANIAKLIDLCDKDMVFSLEHHLKFATADQPFEQIKDSCEFVYKNVGEAFVDSVKNAKIMLSQAGYKEADEGNFIK